MGQDHRGSDSRDSRKPRDCRDTVETPPKAEREGEVSWFLSSSLQEEKWSSACILLGQLSQKSEGKGVVGGEVWFVEGAQDRV